MTRKEQIKKEAIDYAFNNGLACYDFIKGAEWADNNPEYSNLIWLKIKGRIQIFLFKLYGGLF